MGNRCDHNPAKLRTCNIARHGKRGHHQVIQIVCSFLEQAVTNRGKLPDWNSLNPSGSRKRTETWEPGLALLQNLFVKWYQVDTGRCAITNMDLEFIEVPNVAHLAMNISSTKDWVGKKALSVGRLYAVEKDLEAAGYIKRSKQARWQNKDGKYAAAARMITFKKKFFLHLGGKWLWNKVKEARVQGMKTKKAAAQMYAQKGIIGVMQKYMNPGKIFTPRKARELVAEFNRNRPPDKIEWIGF